MTCFIEIPEFKANSVDPDQTPRSVASVLGLHCLPMSLLWNTIGINELSRYYICPKIIQVNLTTS